MQIKSMEQEANFIGGWFGNFKYIVDIGDLLQFWIQPFSGFYAGLGMITILGFLVWRVFQQLILRKLNYNLHDFLKRFENRNYRKGVYLGRHKGKCAPANVFWSGPGLLLLSNRTLEYFWGGGSHQRIGGPTRIWKFLRFVWCPLFWLIRWW